MRLRLWPRRARRLRPRMRALGRGIVSPYAELGLAFLGALFGAWLIALWAVGLLIIVFALLLAVDALFRGERLEVEPKTRHEEIVEQWRKAR